MDDPGLQVNIAQQYLMQETYLAAGALALLLSTLLHCRWSTSRWQLPDGLLQKYSVSLVQLFTTSRDHVLAELVAQDLVGLGNHVLVLCRRRVKGHGRSQGLSDPASAGRRLSLEGVLPASEDAGSG